MFWVIGPPQHYVLLNNSFFHSYFAPHVTSLMALMECYFYSCYIKLFYRSFSFMLWWVCVVCIPTCFFQNQRLNAEEPILKILWLTVNQEIMRTWTNTNMSLIQAPLELLLLHPILFIIIHRMLGLKMDSLNRYQAIICYFLQSFMWKCSMLKLR